MRRRFRQRYPIVDVPLDHTLFHTLYDDAEIPQIPSIDFWTAGRLDV